MKILFETIVASLDDALVAETNGADRFELCSALALGGLTPSLALLRDIKKECQVPVMAMVRPREGGMCYTEREFVTMLGDAAIFIENGADGLVFGFLKADGGLDVDRCEKLISLTNQAGRSVQTVFHRAFDVVAQPDRALEQLVDLGVTRILTSGRAATALEGMNEIRHLVQLADGRIEILPGGGINGSNVKTIVQETGVNQVHLYLTRTSEDTSVRGNPKVYFGAHMPGSESEIHVKCPSLVKQVRESLNSI